MPMARRKREDETAAATVSLDDKRAAERALLQAWRDGQLDEADYQYRRMRVLHAVTPRDLWKATGGRSGSRRRSDWAEIRRALWLQVAVIAFAAVAMVFVLWGTVVYMNDGMPEDARILPWDW
jgi:hypothetical protein